jgi:hypothetical protein
MKAFVVNRNRVTLTVNLCTWLAERGLEVIIVDNASAYPPLLDYYTRCPFKVMRLKENFGHTVIWLNGIAYEMGVKGRYIVTDPDLDLSGVPNDFVSVLSEGLDRHMSYPKCALSLELNDLPSSTEGNFIRKHEAKYWTIPLNDKYFLADTDTTLALYREGTFIYSLSAIRTNRPYTARHIPWYYTDFDNLPDDEKYYFLTANGSSSGKNRLLK